MEDMDRKDMLAALRTLEEQLTYYRSKIRHQELLKKLILDFLEAEGKNNERN